MARSIASCREARACCGSSEFPTPVSKRRCARPCAWLAFRTSREQKALVAEIRRDLGDRPGDLALAQMALWTVWRNRRAHGGSLLKAYVNVGGVSGALAQEAERVRTGSAAFSPEGARVVTASGDKTARLWDAATGKQVAVLRGHDDLVRSAAFSPDGSRVVTASEDKTARLWDVGAIPEATLFQIACTWLPRLDRCCTRLWRDQSSTDM
jgi:hypothetical protein